MSTTTAPGVRRARISPRKRAQRIRWVQYAVLVLVAAWLLFSINWANVQQVFFRPDLVVLTLTSGLPHALLNTVIYTAGAFVVGLTFGTILALMRLSQVGPYRWIASIYIEFFREFPRSSCSWRSTCFRSPSPG